MNRKLAAIALAIGFAFSLGACVTAEPVSGTITGRYIEDFTEPTLIMQGDDGNVHHFTVTRDQYNDFPPTGTNADGTDKYGQRFNSNDVDAPAED